MRTLKLLLVSPLAKVSLPAAYVKSLVGDAVLPLTRYSTETVESDGPVRVTVTATLPPPSGTLKLLALNRSMAVTDCVCFGAGAIWVCFIAASAPAGFVAESKGVGWQRPSASGLSHGGAFALTAPAGKTGRASVRAGLTSRTGSAGAGRV